MEIEEKDVELVDAFLQREAQDYPGGNHQTEAIKAKLLEAIKKEDSNAYWVSIKSLGNMGDVHRILILAVKYKSGIDFGKCLSISLCPCGMACHWGGYSIRDWKGI